MSSIFEEIASRIDYQSLYSEYLRVRRRGNRLTALCPFHQEKSPSFTIDLRTGLWHCFGCKAGGNVFQFIERIENMEMRDVVQLLARKYGVDLSILMGKREKARLTKREIYLKILSASAKFYASELFSTSHGQKALSYLQGRGLTLATIKRFGIGVTPREPDGLTKTLLSKNIKAEVLVELGLSLPPRAGESRERSIDFFRQRIMFPLFNLRGEVVSFAGRTLTNEEPKYLNTSNTPVYKKSRLLYGLNFARNAISEKDSAYVVEGYMDVLMLHQAGILNSVATCGTALTSEHIRELARYTDNLLLAFDGDKAGVSAALRAAEECLALGHFPEILLFKDGKDPADIVAESGKEGFENFSRFGLRTSYPRLLVATMVHKLEPDESELKRVFNSARPIYQRISDPITASHFTRELADALKLSQRQVVDILGKGATPHSNIRGDLPISDRLGKPVAALYCSLFYLILNDTSLIANVRSQLSPEDFPKGIFRDAWEEIAKADFFVGSPDTPESVRTFFARVLAGEESFTQFSLETLIKGIKQLRVSALSEKILQKKRELTKAVEAGNQELSQKLRGEIESLLRRKLELSKEIGLRDKSKAREQNDSSTAEKLLGSKPQTS